jgi:hypothetical protein
MTILSAHEAIQRLSTDRQALTEAIASHSEEDLLAPYHARGGPLGDACESLRDLVAHVLMWNEISLAALTEAAVGRTHWSLQARWEVPAAGRRLNAAGVAAGRELSMDLLMHRSTSVWGSLLAELEREAAAGWMARLPTPIAGHETRGQLAQHVMSVPNVAPYWHAALHLGKLPEVAT